MAATLSPARLSTASFQHLPLPHTQVTSSCTSAHIPHHNTAGQHPHSCRLTLQSVIIPPAASASAALQASAAAVAHCISIFETQQSPAKQPFIISSMHLQAALQPQCITHHLHGRISGPHSSKQGQSNAAFRGQPGHFLQHQQGLSAYTGGTATSGFPLASYARQQQWRQKSPPMDTINGARGIPGNVVRRGHFPSLRGKRGYLVSCRGTPHLVSSGRTLGQDFSNSSTIIQLRDTSHNTHSGLGENSMVHTFGQHKTGREFTRAITLPTPFVAAQLHFSKRLRTPTVCSPTPRQQGRLIWARLSGSHSLHHARNVTEAYFFPRPHGGTGQAPVHSWGEHQRTISRFSPQEKIETAGSFQHRTGGENTSRALLTSCRPAPINQSRGRPRRHDSPPQEENSSQKLSDPGG